MKSCFIWSVYFISKSSKTKWSELCSPHHLWTTHLFYFSWGYDATRQRSELWKSNEMFIWGVHVRVVSSNVMQITQRSLTCPKKMHDGCVSVLLLCLLLCLSLLIYSRANSRSRLWYLNRERPLHFFTLTDSVSRRGPAPFTWLSKNDSQTVLTCTNRILLQNTKE